MKSFFRHAIRALMIVLPLSGGAANIRDLKYEITDTAIVFPESTQTDVHLMQRNWYLQNYTALERESASDAGDMSDETLIKRLQSIPSTIEMPFNPVVKNHIDLYVNRRRSLVEAMLGMSLYYMPIFEEALEREGLPHELKYLPVIESALNPDAVSRAGATGLWQFMLPTAKGLGMEINTLVDERRDPLVSSQMAARYLRQLYEIYHDWGLAIAAYNCGPGNINKALARAGATADNPKDYWDIYYYLPAETRGYVPGFIGATYAMTNYADHGISPSLASRPILTDTVHVNNRLYFSSIASVLDISVDELKVLNPQYRRQIIPGDVKPYVLRLPSQMVYNFLMLEDSIIAESGRLAPRSVVEVGGPAGTSGETVKWHKVKRGETLASIARKYGVTQREIRSWNGLKSSKIARGKLLKIIVCEAPKHKEDVSQQGQVDVIYEDPAQQQSEATAVVSESAVAAAAVVEGEEPTVPDVLAAEAEPEFESASDEPEAPAAPESHIHKVVKGDTLYSLSKRYGVSVDAIRQANGLKDSSLRIGQRLKIPSK
ncbi:MAG: LysM peptidoglycan-binding domain-containing protein [Muribaculaceae bacterium]|nr:LysM peptidoglycan-binding domain-containing protein [Muribaculaceae bacterium]